MSYLLEELRPENPFIVLSKNEVLEFSLITLRLTVKLVSRYGSLNGSLDIIHTDPKEIFNIGHILADDNKRFPTAKKFIEYLYSGDLGTDELAQELTRVFHESVVASLPQNKNRKLQDEYNKAVGADKKDVCYGRYYDTIAKRYSYTLEQFMNITLRQLVIILDVAGDGGYEELEVQASLMGRKLLPRNKPLEIDDKESAKRDDEAMELLKRQREKYEQGKK